MTGLGVGKDVWTIPFDKLPQILKVRFLSSPYTRAVVNLGTGLLRRRDSVSDRSTDDQDSYLLHLPSDFPAQELQITCLHRHRP